MKRILFCLLILCPTCLLAQIGVKGGLNFANVSNASSINSSSQTGFLGGLFLAPPSKGVMGFRTEIIYSRQGYNYKTGTNTGNVNLDYILLPQLTCINITKFFQIQLGAQIAFLVNAKADSTTSATTTSSGNQMMDMYNKFDYGFAGGIEIHPIKGLLIGARLNISLGDMYKMPEPGQTPSFYPSVNAKNNVLQIFAGWRFGK